MTRSLRLPIKSCGTPSLNASDSALCCTSHPASSRRPARRFMPEPDSPAISVRTLLLRTKAFVVFNNDFAGNDLLLQLLALIHNILWELISQSFLHDGKIGQADSALTQA